MMKNVNRITIPYLSTLLLVGFMVTRQSGAATLPNTEPTNDPGVTTVLKQQIEPEENLQLQSSLRADVDTAVSGLEWVVVWTKLGATYWSNNLSVLAQQGQQWRVLASLSLEGTEAQLAAVAPDGTLVVTAKTLAANDPICCPSQHKTMHYRYRLGQLFEIQASKKAGRS
jgi:hypothetical protein